MGAAIGASLGGPGGGVLGSALGSGAQALFRRITGYGDYKVVSNSLMGMGDGKMAVDSLPQFSGMGRGIRISHREYILDVISSATAGAFSSTDFLIQPALQASFPWLSAIAEQFEEYKINGMIFEFKTMSADALNSTNTALGSVILSTQYNVLHPTFVNKVQMEQHEFSVSGKPSCNILHPIECARGESMATVLYTRNGPVVTGDQRLYDFGRFTIASTGLQGTSVNIGELWVSYDITLFKPRVQDSSDLADHYQLGTGISTSAYFGSTLPTATSTSDMGTVLTNTTITIPATFTGNIQVTYSVVGSAAAVATPSITPSAGAVALNLVNSDAANYMTCGTVGSTITAVLRTWFFTCTQGGVLTLSGGTMPGSPTYGELFIITVPSTLTN